MEISKDYSDSMTREEAWEELHRLYDKYNETHPDDIISYDTFLEEVFEKNKIGKWHIVHDKNGINIWLMTKKELIRYKYSKLIKIWHWIIGLSILGGISYIDITLSDLYDLDTGGWLIIGTLIGAGAFADSYYKYKKAEDKKSSFRHLILIVTAYICLVVLWRYIDEIQLMLGDLKWIIFPILFVIGIFIYWIVMKDV